MAAIKPLSNSYPQGAMPVPAYVLARALAASTAEAMTVPAGAQYVFLIHNGTATYARFDATATVPGDTTDGTASMLIPATGLWVSLEGVTTVSVISAGTPIVTATFFK